MRFMCMIYAFRTCIFTTCHSGRVENAQQGLSWVRVVEIISGASRKIKNSVFFTKLKKDELPYRVGHGSDPADFTL